MFKIYDEPESPNEGACLRCMMNRHRQMTGRWISCTFVCSFDFFCVLVTFPPWVLGGVLSHLGLSVRLFGGHVLDCGSRWSKALRRLSCVRLRVYRSRMCRLMVASLLEPTKQNVLLYVRNITRQDTCTYKLHGIKSWKHLVRC